jgi:hypothetical protein
MVLLKRPEYRAALEGFLEFRRRALVRIEEPALDAPLDNLPFLYQTWGVLEVVAVLLDLAADAGFVIRHQELVHRNKGELWVRLVRNGKPAAVLSDPGTGTVVTLIPQRSYSRAGNPVHSASFEQITDISIEIRDASGEIRVLVFDPKYKLQSEENEGRLSADRPKKVDIDAMHAYRDALRNQDDQRVVELAAILYPGPSAAYGVGLRAIRAIPSQSNALRSQLREVLEPALRGAAPRASPVAA